MLLVGEKMEESMKPIEILISYDKDRVAGGFYDKANGYYNPLQTPYLSFDKADKYASYALIGLLVCGIVAVVV